MCSMQNTLKEDSFLCKNFHVKNNQKNHGVSIGK